MRSSLKVEGYTKSQDESCHTKQCQAGSAARLEDNNLSRHRNQGHFKDQSNVNDVLLHVALKRLQQLDPDQDQQEKRENLKKALHLDEKPRRLPDLVSNQET